MTTAEAATQQDSSGNNMCVHKGSPLRLAAWSAGQAAVAIRWAVSWVTASDGCWSSAQNVSPNLFPLSLLYRLLSCRETNSRLRASLSLTHCLRQQQNYNKSFLFLPFFFHHVVPLWFNCNREQGLNTTSKATHSYSDFTCRVIFAFVNFQRVDRSSRTAYSIVSSLKHLIQWLRHGHDCQTLCLHTPRPCQHVLIGTLSPGKVQIRSRRHAVSKFRFPCK